MKTILFLLLSLAGLFSSAQEDRWKVTHNGKLKLQAEGEQEEKNVVNISIADLKKNSFLLVNFSEKEKQKDWTRVIVMVDEQENEFFKSNGNLLKVQNPSLRNFSRRAKVIKIYTWALPKDPELAARIRVRRVHLATIVFK